MNLLPAIRHDGQIITGGRDDSHGTIIEEHGLTNLPDSAHGFSPSGSKIFIPRKQAAGWVQQHEPSVFRKLGTLPKEGLHSHIYARAKNIKQKDITESVDVSNKTCIVYDRGGLYTYKAQRLGKDFGKVLYYIPDAMAFPESPKYWIGKGLQEIERIDDKGFYKNLDKADLIYFPDAYDGAFQNYLRNKGYLVYGSGLCEKMEIDKIFFLDVLTRVGLPVIHTQLVKGADALIEYMESRPGPKWLKSLYRGDHETKKADDIDQLKLWIEHELVPRIGARTKTMQVLVQDPIESDVEVGYDGIMIDGECLDDCLIGYEVKDTVYVAKVHDKVPKIIKDVNDKMAPEFKKIGPYRGEYSTELRITEDGKAYYIDASCRVPSPPGELFSSMCENYSEVVWLTAKGVKPKLKWKAQFGAQIVLSSKWYEKNPLIVKFPEKWYDNVKLKMHYGENGYFTCVPNGNEEYFGAAVAWADTKDEAMQLCMDIAKEIDCEDFLYKGGEGTFTEANKAIEAGAKYGIDV